jgi:hypothetical protein
MCVKIKHLPDSRQPQSTQRVQIIDFSPKRPKAFVMDNCIGCGICTPHDTFFISGNRD